jgi:putative ABC transport system permease protein
MSEWKRLFGLSLKFVSHRRLRSFLTTLGIAVGVALVFCLMSINQGLINYVYDSVESFGANLVYVVPKNFPNFGGVSFTQNEVDAIGDLGFVKNSIGMYTISLPIEVSNQELFRAVYGMEDGLYESFPDTQVFEVERGRDFTSSERKKVTIGYRIANDYGLDPGSVIKIDGVDFRVSGVFSEIGNGDDDYNIIANVKDLWEITGEENKYHMIYIYVNELKVEEIKKVLKRMRGVEDFDVMTSESMLKQVNEVLGILNAIFIAMAGISIIVGSVGVANTMYMAVTERVKDIGIMKAIGATGEDISVLFLLESGMISLLGGFFGMILGALMAVGLSYLAGALAGLTAIKPAFNPELFLISAVLSFVVGMASGIFPARSASRLEPIQAFHHE